jgi:hypothetical protein
VSAVLPDRLPLDPPEEDRTALAEVVEGIRGAAFRLGLLDVHLAGPAAAAPGWLGRDAAAATTQIAAATRLGREMHGALTEALRVLDRHGELLDHVRARIEALRAQQREDYDAAAARLGVLISTPGLPAPAGEPAPIMALRDDLAAAEVARQREHAALLAELRADAVATAHALSAATAVAGGTGRRGEALRVIAHLAAVLPGWGDAELAARGADLARTALELPSLRGADDPARGAEVPAASPAFAGALLTALGPAGVRRLLYLIGIDGIEPGDPWAVVLATALGAARRDGTATDPVGEVLDAGYVGRDGDDDAVAAGIGSVLAAGAAVRGGGVPIRTVAEWGRQVLVREDGLRKDSPGAYRAVDRAGGRWPGLVDPVAEVLRLLARADDPAASALLLDDRRSWAALLARPLPTYPDGGGNLRDVVQQATGLAGPAGERAVRSGLEALGTGLSDGDPDHWPAHPTTAAAVAFPLAEGVAGHVTVATEPLGRSGSGRPLDVMADAVLRGLGLVSLDPGGAAVITQAVSRWAVARTADIPNGGWAAATAVGGFVAVRQYGQRLAHALHGFEQRDAALSRQHLFDRTVGLLQFLPAEAGAIAGFLLPFAAHWLGADGTWQNGPDAGLVFRADDAAAAAEVQLDPGDLSRSQVLGVRAAAAFARVMGRLGVPVPPDSPVWRWEQAALDGVPLPDKAKQLGLEVPTVRQVVRDVVHGKGLQITVREGWWGVNGHPFDDGSSNRVYAQ